MPDKMLKTLHVSVKRADETIAAEVFAHELPILRRMHLYENVNVLDEDYGELPLPDDADLELRRLQGKYDRKNAAVVGALYRDAQEVAKATGLKLLSERTARASEADIHNRLREKKATKKAA